MIDQAVDHFGGLNILFNNAGIGGAVGPITHIDADEWDKSFQILLKSVFLGSKYAARVMKKNASGGTWYTRTQILQFMHGGQAHHRGEMVRARSLSHGPTYAHGRQPIRTASLR